MANSVLYNKYVDNNKYVDLAGFQAFISGYKLNRRLLIRDIPLDLDLEKLKTQSKTRTPGYRFINSSTSNDGIERLESGLTLNPVAFKSLVSSRSFNNLQHGFSCKRISLECACAITVAG